MYFEADDTESNFIVLFLVNSSGRMGRGRTGEGLALKGGEVSVRGRKVTWVLVFWLFKN